MPSPQKWSLCEAMDSFIIAGADTSTHHVLHKTRQRPLSIKKYKPLTKPPLLPLPLLPPLPTNPAPFTCVDFTSCWSVDVFRGTLDNRTKVPKANWPARSQQTGKEEPLLLEEAGRALAHQRPHRPHPAPACPDPPPSEAPLLFPGGCLKDHLEDLPAREDGGRHHLTQECFPSSRSWEWGREPERGVTVLGSG